MILNVWLSNCPSLPPSSSLSLSFLPTDLSPYLQHSFPLLSHSIAEWANVLNAQLSDIYIVASCGNFFKIEII